MFKVLPIWLLALALPSLLAIIAQTSHAYDLAPLMSRQGCQDPLLVPCGALCCRTGSKCLDVKGFSTCCSPGVSCANITGQCNTSTVGDSICPGFENSFCCPSGTVCKGFSTLQSVECSTRGESSVAQPAPPAPSTTTSTSTSTTARPTPTPVGARVLNNDPRIQYNPPNAWSNSAAPSCADSGSLKTTNSVGAAFSLQYTGPIAIRTVSSRQGSTFSVSINGGKEQNFTTYSASNSQSCGFTFTSQSLQAQFPILADGGSVNSITLKFGAKDPEAPEGPASFSFF